MAKKAVAKAAPARYVLNMDILKALTSVLGEGCQTVVEQKDGLTTYMAANDGLSVRLTRTVDRNPTTTDFKLRLSYQTIHTLASAFKHRKGSSRLSGKFVVLEENDRDERWAYFTATSTWGVSEGGVDSVGLVLPKDADTNATMFDGDVTPTPEKFSDKADVSKGIDVDWKHIALFERLQATIFKGESRRVRMFISKLNCYLASEHIEERITVENLKGQALLGEIALY